MPSKVSEHFDNYSMETAAKHQILTQYLPAYLTALSQQIDAFHYIDGFAGRGEYDGTPGSPVRAVELIEDLGWLYKTQLSFVEEKADNFDTLKTVLDPLLSQKLMMGWPYMEQGLFEDHIDKILTLPVYKNRRVATFTFIDPCGVSGVRMADIAKLLQLSFGEVLLFFNYDGMNRVLGSVIKDRMNSGVAAEFFGDEEKLEALLSAISDACPSEKERLIKDALLESIRNFAGGKYIIPFRFGHKNSPNRTSHYLIHISAHHLPFKIMKDVMRKAGKKEGSSCGSLFLDKDVDQPLLFEVDPDVELEKEIIFQKLEAGPVQVSEICSRVVNPASMLAEFEYKNILKELESTNRIQVFDKTNTQPYPSTVRRAGTLADSCWLRLKGQR